MRSQIVDALDSGVASTTKIGAGLSPPPTIKFTSLRFSDGTECQLGATDIVVFVGPNNAGKSAALGDLEGILGNDNHSGTVIKSAETTRSGTIADLHAYLAKHGRLTSVAGIKYYTGIGFRFPEAELQNHFSSGGIRSFFCSRIRTEDRIIFGNERRNIDNASGHPEHPTHILLTDRDAAKRICNYFNRAFSKDLFPFYGRGLMASLLVGTEPAYDANERPTDQSYINKVHASAWALDRQGDGMRSFASVAIGLLTTLSQSVLLLDEPEAFLHPPQARLLGEFIAKERPPHSQVFIATHSADVVQGIVGAAQNHLRIFRIVRDGNVNRFRELNNEQIKAIGNDPLMRYSGVLSGMFHERAIVCEGDADCMFYNALVNLPGIRGQAEPDVVFVHSAGLGRVPSLATALNALGVRTDVIVDFDVLRDPTNLQRVTTAAGVDWLTIEQPAESVRKAVNNKKLKQPSERAKQQIEELLKQVPDTEEFPTDFVEKVRRLANATSPWGLLKEVGKVGIPSGTPFNEYEKLETACNAAGMWIVPVGELEGWRKDVGGHGPSWAQQVVSDPNFEHDPNLADARAFMTRIWKRKPSSQ